MDGLARALAASASSGGGGGGGTTNVVAGKGITITGDDEKTIINTGVRSIAQSKDGGSIIVNTNGKEETYSISSVRLRSGNVRTCSVANDPVLGYKVGDAYIDFILDRDGKTSTGDEEHVYVLVSEINHSSAADVKYDNKSTSSVVTATTLQGAIDEIAVLATPTSTDEKGKNGLMSVYDKNKLDNMGTFKDDDSMKLAIDGLFSGYDMSGLDPDDDDGIADHSDIEDIFSDDTPPPSSRDAETAGSFTSLSADEIDDMFGEGTTTPDDSDDEEDGDDSDLDTGDIDDILGI